MLRQLFDIRVMFLRKSSCFFPSDRQISLGAVNCVHPHMGGILGVL